MARPTALNVSRLLAVVIAATALVACGEDDVATPVTGTDDGALQVDGADFVSEAQLFVHACEPQGVGNGEIAGQVANFTFTSCTGEQVSLHDYCGRRKAMWIVGAAGWCGQCIAHLPDVIATSRSLRHEGLETFVFLGEDQSSGAVSMEYCQGFAQQHGVDPAMMLIAPDQPDALQLLWNYMRPAGSTIGLPWEAVLDPYDMTFYWDSSRGGADPYPPINELLAE